MSAVTYRTAPGTTSPNGLPLGGFYRYRGTGVDVLEPLPRKRGGPRRARLSGAILGVLADLGGEASTTEIRKALEASGFVITASRQVPDALHRLARLTPPAVTAAGECRGGFGRVQRWRLRRAETAPAVPVRRRCSGCGYYKTSDGCRTVCGGERAA
jgi:hypothetical protein